MIKCFDHLLKATRTGEPRSAILIFPEREDHLKGAILTQEVGLAQCTLIGDVAHVSALANETGINLSALTLIDEPDAQRATQRALVLCKEGKADLLVNGNAPLRVLLPAVLDRQTGIRTGSLLSGVSVLELDGFNRLLLLSDGLMVVSPNLEQRIQIVQNAIQVAHKLGIECPRVALVAATEAVDPKSQVSVDAAQITMMSRRKQIKGAIVDGPLGFDNAISSRAAQVKGISSDVSGKVDILIAPDLNSGNMLTHTLHRLCRGKVLNVVTGGQVPLMLLSPDEDIQTQMLAFALGAYLS